jgi:hypothetical protein
MGSRDTTWDLRIPQRDQVLLSVDLREWLSEVDLVWHVVDVVELAKLRPVPDQRAGCGSVRPDDGAGRDDLRARGRGEVVADDRASLHPRCRVLG